MSRNQNDNTVGPWAKTKLKVLEEYLNAYHLVMKKQPFELIYIDAFAGGGSYEVRKKNPQNEELTSLFPLDPHQKEFIKGSPQVALDCGSRGFHEYYFFDIDKQRVNELENIKRENSSKSIHVCNKDANSGVQELATLLRKRNVRAVAFLDPYGAHLHWLTIEALAQTRHVDVIINFPLDMAINRLIKSNANNPENWNNILNLCFGSKEWYNIAYESKKDLFDEKTLAKSKQARSKLLDFYHSRLKDAFGHTVDPSLVKNSKDLPLYYLLWASSNPRGKAIAKHIMKFGEQLSGNNKTKERVPNSFLP